ncbi:esterase [Microbacterium sp. Gd 4-13]|uniref:alpha/beta hydrolase fold domain-containing protein n=1 Tax=Microbacterium sp. Gd 4-13 TaxID=2173179 RepID=UPI000D573FCB|nr:alpha/beta hydrolase fold domain-containing protein [Microbacterium sp. Gd 4-13]PVW06703.1 esterase [Microbacterium sp. Gd 4-13]
MATVPAPLVPIVLRMLRANRTFVTADGARRRVRQRELRPSAYGPPPRLRADLRVEVEHVDWPVYTVAPRDREPSGGVVYVHGGGWVNEIVAQHWQLIAQLAAESGVAVTVPIYPLVPFGTASTAHDGVVALVKRSVSRYGTTMLAGDSAGGQIALSAAQTLRDAGVAVAGSILISPALDLTWSNPRIPEVQPSDPWLATPGGRVLADLWRGDRALTDPVVSPLFGEMRGLAPITLFTGTRDVLNPDAHLLVDAATAAGVDIDLHEAQGHVHVYPLLPTRLGVQVRAKIIDVVRRAVAQRGSQPT